MRVLEGRVIKGWTDKRGELEGLHSFLCIKANKCTEKWARQTGSLPYIMANALKIVRENVGDMKCTKKCAGVAVSDFL